MSHVGGRWNYSDRESTYLPLLIYLCPLITGGRCKKCKFCVCAAAVAMNLSMSFSFPVGRLPREKHILICSIPLWFEQAAKGGPLFILNSNPISVLRRTKLQSHSNAGLIKNDTKLMERLLLVGAWACSAQSSVCRFHPHPTPSEYAFPIWVSELVWLACLTCYLLLLLHEALNLPIFVPHWGLVHSAVNKAINGLEPTYLKRHLGLPMS